MRHSNSGNPPTVHGCFLTTATRDTLRLTTTLLAHYLSVWQCWRTTLLCTLPTLGELITVGEHGIVWGSSSSRHERAVWPKRRSNKHKVSHGAELAGQSSRRRSPSWKQKQQLLFSEISCCLHLHQSPAVRFKIQTVNDGFNLNQTSQKDPALSHLVNNPVLLIEASAKMEMEILLKLWITGVEVEQVQFRIWPTSVLRLSLLPSSDPLSSV